MASGISSEPDVPVDLIRTRIRRHFRQLTQDLLPHYLIPYMVQNNVLDLSEADMVLSEPGLLRQSTRILTLVERKDEQALRGFLTSLQEGDHGHLAQVLQMPPDAEDIVTDGDTEPRDMDAPGQLSLTWTQNEVSAFDIRISLRNHGDPVPASQIPARPSTGLAAQATTSALVQGQSASASTSACPAEPGHSSPTRSHGSCPSPGCRCGELHQSLFQTLSLAQQSLANHYPLRSDQDVQRSAECRQTISQCLEVLRWMSAGGMHTQKVLQACVLLRVTCRDVEALDNLLKMVRDGILQKNLERVFQASLLVKIKPMQYLQYREYIETSSKGFNEFRSRYPKAFLRRMGFDEYSETYLQLIHCKLAKDQRKYEAQTAKEYWLKSCGETKVLINDWGASMEAQPKDAPGTAARLVESFVPGLLSLTGIAAKLAAAGDSIPSQPSPDKARLLLDAFLHHVKMTQQLLDGLCIYRYTTYVFARNLIAFGGHGGERMKTKGFGAYTEHLKSYFGPPHQEFEAFDIYIIKVYQDSKHHQQLLREYLSPVKIEPCARPVLGACRDLQVLLGGVKASKDGKAGLPMKLISESLQRIEDGMQGLEVECGLEA